MKDGYGTAPLWALGGLFIGAWAGNRLGFGHGCGGYGPGYGGGYGPGYGNCGPAYGPGYYTGDRPCHEDKQDDKIAYLMAESAANKVAIRKDEKIAFLEDQVLKGELKGDIFRSTCMKPDGNVYLPPTRLAEPYHSERNIIVTRQDRCRDGRRNDDCDCNSRDWY